jgi:hypothetical protein
MDRAYGPCADVVQEMAVGTVGSLAEMLPFCGAR